ncbi:MAG: tyrosine-type recombinase/integrase [Alteromonadales bacterium]|nr:tyrosine-type recombinase/integrase [Alteromonadales bacterium]
MVDGLVDEKQWIQVQAVKPLKFAPPSSWKALVSSSVRLLLSQCRKDTKPIGVRDTAILAVFLATGLRRSELAKLQVGDYDIKEQKFKSDQKTSECPVSPHQINLIRIPMVHYFIIGLISISKIAFIRPSSQF